MAVTNIREIRNMSSFTANVINWEHTPDTDGQKGRFSAGESRPINIAIPWCGDGQGFTTKHIDVTLTQRTGNTDTIVRRFRIWQAQHATDRVRVSLDGNWHNPGDEIGGYAAVGPLEEFTFGDDRVLFINDFSLWLLPTFLVNPLKDMAKQAATKGYRICGEASRRATPSIPKLNASAFSMAGIPSDAFDRKQRDARLLYRDSGKRYEFKIVDGRVTVDPPVMVPSLHGTQLVPALTEAISFNQLRRGEPIALPQFDLVAANGGRVFAKEKDTDRLFVATIDEMFIHSTPEGGEFTVPSSYFKLDPEFNLATAQMRDLMAHMDGDFARHPAVIRFPLFRVTLGFGLAPTMIVRAQRGVWHLIDARMPPISDLAGMAEGLIALIKKISPLLQHYSSLSSMLDVYQEVFRDPTPPAGVPRYNQVQYCPNPPDSAIWEPAIDVARVLDIGVGHVHYHQQYERITGGELQMLRTPSNPDFIHDHLAVYQFLNGPAVDSDGYNDGTCNFYMLAQLRDNSFAVLYLDEQSYFSPRWRLADPADYRGTIMTLAADLAMNPGPAGRYPWTPDKYWSPLRAGKIGPTSRMAVSAQVILVTGNLLDKSPLPLIYSTNFSWGTMDWTWRWRSLPQAAVRRLSDTSVTTGEEIIQPDTGDTVYPQTIRLRDDMTLHMKGTRNGVMGRWFQRYLPASNQPVPPPAQLASGQQPATGYHHQWKFMSEPLFQLADRFSHFLVYDQVDSRTQYYPVQPGSDADGKQLDAIANESSDWWIDASQSLFNSAYTFHIDTMSLPWPPWPPFPKVPMRPPSLYNTQTLLRIVRRGPRLIAIRRDKRDDDMALFDGLPQPVILRNHAGNRTVHATVQPGVRLEEPPAVQKVFFWLAGTQAAVAFTPPMAAQPFDNVFRVRMAALGGKTGAIPLFDLVTPGQFKFTDGYYQFQWVPQADQLALLKQYASADGERNYATSIWLEDVVGHAAPPEELWWLQPPRITVKVIPANIPVDVPVSVTVHATDSVTAAPVKGEVRIDETPIGVTDKPFSFTFHLSKRVFDPETKAWQIQQVESEMTVLAEGYPEVAVPLHFVKR